MKKGLIFATTLAMALGVGVAVGAHQGKVAKVEATDSVVYLKPSSNWSEANARFEVWNWSNDSDGEWLDMTEVATDPGTYKTTLASGKNNLIFVRKGPAQAHHTWEEIWTQSANLTYDSTKTRYEVSGWNDGEWKAYSEPAAASVYKYSLNGATGVEMTKGSGYEYTSAELDFAKGDVVSFTKDSAAYAVAPKDSGQQTKVYAVEGGLKFAEAYHGALYLDTSDAVLWAGQFTPGYYLAGVGGEWEPKLALPAAKVSEQDPAYVVEDVVLAAGEAVKFINFPETGNIVSYYNADANKIITSSEVKYSVDDYSNLKVTNAGTYDIYYNPESGYYSIEDVNYVPDVPATEGYYIKGSAIGWRYDAAIKMDAGTGGNVAQKMEITVAVNDEIRVCSYFNDRDPKDQWATLGNGEETFGEKSGDNFKFTVAGKYDIYAKYEDKDDNPLDDEAFMFYVAEHVDSYTVTMVGVKFAGAVKESTVALANQTAYATSNFNPTIDTVSGYVSREVYTDENCTTEYTPKKFDAAGTLYVKYTKVGYYVIYGPDYSIDDAKLMNTTGIASSNKAETYLADVKVGDCVSFVYYDGQMDGQNGLDPNEQGITHSYAIYEDNHVKFTKAGSYAAYFGNDDYIYLNAGLTAFLTNFISEIGGVCNEQGQTDFDNLVAAWNIQKAAYNGLDAAEKAELEEIGYNGGKEDGTLAQQMVAKYHYILEKYGTSQTGLSNFIWGVNVTPNPAYNSQALFNNVDNTMMIVIISIAATSVLAFGTFLYLKKRKQK